jgi:hypothetical protein
MTTTQSETALFCAICGCSIHRMGQNYGQPSVEGRSHATRHHYVAERFYGRSANRRGETGPAIFADCPWGVEGRSEMFCYDCHEVLLHNPVLLHDDIGGFAQLVRARGLDEERKTDDQSKLAGRIELLHEVIRTGIRTLKQEIQGPEAQNHPSEDTS